MPIEVRPDPVDGLPASEAREWAAEKHELLRAYLHRSNGTRRRWLGGKNGTTYIELFSGPGRSFLKGTDTFIDGSPIVAHREVAETSTAFSEMHLGDERPDFCDAVSQRLRRLGANPITYAERADVAARRIKSALNKYGLHFAFLDPYKLELPFTIIEAFSGFKHMDVLIHVSAMDLQRNLPEFVESVECPLDQFAPGWRKAVGDLNPSEILARGKILEYWVSLIGQLGFGESNLKWHLVRGSNNQPLYWLVLIAKNPLAWKFWNDIVNRKKPNLQLFD